MSSINKIGKFKYTKKTPDVVSLNEYILFEDNDKTKKYAALQFHNCLNQVLKSFTFQVKEYNINNFLIEKKIIKFDEEFKPNNDFVPNAKLNLSYECNRFEIDLIEAVFENIIWTNGEFSPIKLKFKEFELNEQEKKEESPKKKPKKKKEKEFNINKFKCINVTKSNKPKGYRIYGIIVTIIAILLMIGGAYFFSLSNNTYFDGTFFYTINEEDNTCNIVGCDKSIKYITIPNMIDEKYTVIEIKGNSFKDSNVEEIHINATNLKLCDDAFMDAKKLKKFYQNDKKDAKLFLSNGVFKNCESLTDINIENVTDIYSYSFENCTSLKELYVPNAKLFSNVFLNCNSLTKLTYNITSSNITFRSLFGDNDISSLTYVSTYMSYIKLDYFGDFNSITKLELRNPNVSYSNEAFNGLNKDLTIIKLQ